MGLLPLWSLILREAPFNNKHLTMRVLLASKAALTAKCKGVSPSESYWLISCFQLNK